MTPARITELPTRYQHPTARSPMFDNTLITRCQLAHHEAVGWEYATSHDGTRATLEHVAAELTIAGHRDAADWLLGQLTAQVIELRPERGGAA